MTEQEVIKIIEYSQRCVVGVCDETCKYYSDRCEFNMEDYFEAIGVAKEALKKQIPRKPYIPKIKSVLSVGTCMVCGNCFTSQESYCKRCGQRLDWSEK